MLMFILQYLQSAYQLSTRMVCTFMEQLIPRFCSQSFHFCAGLKPVSPKNTFYYQGENLCFKLCLSFDLTRSLSTSQIENKQSLARVESNLSSSRITHLSLFSRHFFGCASSHHDGKDGRCSQCNPFILPGTYHGYLKLLERRFACPRMLLGVKE